MTDDSTVLLFAPHRDLIGILSWSVRPLHPLKAVSLGCLAALTLAVAAGVVAATAPSHQTVLFEEDGLVETATALTFLAAAVVGAWRLARRARARGVLLAATALAGLATLDELSFGERLFGFEPPVVLNTRIDAVHDLFMLAKRALETSVPAPYLVAGLMLILVSGIAALIAHRLWQAAGRPAPRMTTGLALFGLCIALIGVAQILDLKLRVTPHRTLEPFHTEEVLELAASLVLLAAISIAGGSADKLRAWRRSVRAGLRTRVPRPVPRATLQPSEGMRATR